MGRFPVFSITSSWACLLEMIFTCRSPTAFPGCVLTDEVFKVVYSITWAAPEQGERDLFEAWDI